MDRKNNWIEQWMSSQRSVIRSWTAVPEASNVIWLKCIFLALNETQQLHHGLIIAWGRRCSTWRGMLNSLQKSVVLRAKCLRHRIQWMLSACANTVVGSVYPESKSWPIPSDSDDISPSSSPSLSVIPDVLLSLLWPLSCYFTPSFGLSKPLTCLMQICLLHIYWQFFNWSHMGGKIRKKMKCKTSSFFTKTINHFQVHGSNIRRGPCFFFLVFFFFSKQVARRCQRLPCKLVLKMNAFMFWFGPTE